MAKNLPAMQETQVGSLGGEDPLEREWQPTPVFWPGEFHGLCGSWGRKELDTTERFSLCKFSCLGNPMDRGAWQAIQSVELQRVKQD